MVLLAKLGIRFNVSVDICHFCDGILPVNLFQLGQGVMVFFSISKLANAGRCLLRSQETLMRRGRGLRGVNPCSCGGDDLQMRSGSRVF